jgi:hypothetical protein
LPALRVARGRGRGSESDKGQSDTAKMKDNPQVMHGRMPAFIFAFRFSLYRFQECSPWQ